MADKITPINLEPDKPALDGRQMDKLIELWKEDLRRKIKEVSYKTGVSYINLFDRWWSAHGVENKWLVNDIVFTDYVHYLEGHRTQFGNIMSVGARISSVNYLKAMLRWAYKSGYVSSDFSVFVPTIKEKPERKQAVTIEQLEALLNAAEEMTYSHRNQAIIAVMAGTGIRCIECAALTVGDVSMKGDCCGTLRLRITKNSKPRVVAYDHFTGEYLSRHLDDIAGSLPTATLFGTRHGIPFTPRGIGMLVKSVSQKTGQRIRAHDLRRMFATHWARERPGEGYGQLLQKQMGHATFSMTTQYMLQDVDDLVKVMRNEAISPMAALHQRKSGSTT